MFDASTIQFEESNIIICLVLEHIIIPLPFQHKLNYFSFCRTFEKLFIICTKVLLVQLSQFELQTFHDNEFKLKQSRRTRVLHKIDKSLFIILYNHYLLKISELKN
jgi:hypothetical protein